MSEFRHEWLPWSHDPHQLDVILREIDLDGAVVVAVVTPVEPGLGPYAVIRKPIRD